MFRSFRKKLAALPAARMSQRRLALERLEDRSLLTTFTVHTLLDVPFEQSLRGCIALARLSPGADDIVFDPFLAGGTIHLELGPLEIGDDVTITGPLDAPITIDGQGSTRIFQFDAGATGELARLILTGGVVGNAESRGGGAIYNAGTLTIIDSAIVNSSASRLGVEGGGGISNHGTLTIVRSELRDNEADFGSGGGIYNAGDVTNGT